MLIFWIYTLNVAPKARGKNYRHRTETASSPWHIEYRVMILQGSGNGLVQTPQPYTIFLLPPKQLPLLAN